VSQLTRASQSPSVLLPALDTPALLIDQSRFEANLKRMAERARTARLNLRPHAKTHKSIVVGRRQIDLGAIGVTVAKPEEAMVFWHTGFSPIFLAYPPVGEHKLRRLRPAFEAGALIVGLDDVSVARAIGAFASGLGVTVPVMFEVDVGMRRTGLPAGDQAARAAVEVASVPGIRLAGIYAHEGHAHGVGRARLPEFAADIAKQMRTTAELIRSAGTVCEIVSAGTCLTSWHLNREQGLSEIRPGTYVFNDVRTVLDGGAEWDQCAARVLATVISRPDPARLVIDAGAKTLTTAYDETYGYGLVEGIDGARLARLSEEHGVVTLANPFVDVGVGDRVTVIPIHVCVAVNMQRELYLVDDGAVSKTLKVDAGLLTH
jgi:D-serine deaminase-like pyridoxal phosphate-dependent protein